MKEFTVWDEDIKEFIDGRECLLEDSDIFRNYEDYQLRVSEGLTIFNYTGKTDIEGNKIYADSSIVEFNHDIGIGNWQKSKGYFTYREDTLSYWVVVGRTGHSYFDGRMKDFKIIDTLQENKLRLFGDIES